MATNKTTVVNTNNALKKQDIFVSVVVTPRHHVDNPTDYYRALSGALMEKYANYEIIFIDNSLDGEHIIPIISLLDQLPCMRIVRLSRSYAYDTALMAGIEAAIGDYVVLTDSCLDPINDIHEVVSLNKKYDIVQGVADISERKMLDSSRWRKLFYWYNRKYLGIDVPVQATYFTSLSRRAIRAVAATSRQEVHIRQILKTVGYSYVEYVYKTKEDPTRTTSFRTGIAEALSIVGSHSTHPLRVMSVVGTLASALNLIYAGYVVVVAIFEKNVAAGWTTMSLQLSAMFFILFLFMAILSEYIGKILAETRHDQRYLVMDELTSTVSLANADRKNITKD